MGFFGKKTETGLVCKNNDLRFDREHPCQSCGHPADNFYNYTFQANDGTRNAHLKKLANGENGTCRVPPQRVPSKYMLFRGSTVSSVNSQQNLPLSRHLRSGELHAHSISREFNARYIPAGVRDRESFYHYNPFDGWSDR